MITQAKSRQPRCSPNDTPNPNEQAQQLTGRDYLSHSSISTFQRCPLKFYFSYIAGLEPEFVSSSLVFGGAVHAAIEHHFRCLFEGMKPPAIDALMDAYEQAWKQDNTVPVRFGKTESVDSLRDLATRMLTAFKDSPLTQLVSHTRLLGVEETFRGPLVEGCPDLLGRLDLITLDRGALKITDFKTSRSAWNEAKVQESAPQQLLYSELVKPLAMALENRPVRIEWVVITKAKKPVVEKHTLTPDPNQVARTKSVVRRVWKAITSGHFYPSPSAMNCSTCPHKTACRAWRG